MRAVMKNMTLPNSGLTCVSMAKYEFHVHKAEVGNVKSFDYNQLRKNLNPAPYKSDIAYMCIHGIP